ncbi:MAG: AAA family ATPase [Bacteroidaceae bacterium]|nr:AAA family ATPase [Bacteroidaceae bacterium]
MKYKKGDYIGNYKVLLPLKESDRSETYRVRGTSGFLYALKYGASEAEIQAAPLSDLYIESDCDYVVYRYISGETLETKLLREHKCLPTNLKKFATDILIQIEKFHNNGYTHGNISEGNIMIDLCNDGEPTAWVIGLSSVTTSDKNPVERDIQCIGSIMYRMAFGEMPENPPRVYARRTDSLEEGLLTIIYKAIISDFHSAKEMLDAIEGKSEVTAINRPVGEGFAAVAGMDEIKQRLQEDVIDILADRERAKAYGIEIPNGMLLYGPPGCGKTYIAEKFAEQTAYNYHYVKSSDLASTYLHGTQEKIAALFDKARKNAPTILCFDEFDALVPRRDDANNAGQSAEVNEFLTQLNNCGRDGIFVIATTNRPDKIDSAILRTGRIDYMVYVPVPDEKARMAMFQIALKNKPISDDIDYVYLTEKTNGFLTSDISAIVSESARTAFRKKTVITMQMLKDALNSRTPSLSKETIAEYERLREKFENKKKETAWSRIGFV